MKVVISQPRYLPAINYIQRLYFSDLFIFLDNVQRQKRGWENRNKILLNSKPVWVSIPIASSSKEYIKDTKIHSLDWIRAHKSLLINAYKDHPFYNREIIEMYYRGAEEIQKESNNSFSKVIIHLINNLCRLLGFEPNYRLASEFPETNSLKGPEKLLRLCEIVKAQIYISGPNGRKYGVIETFKKSKIKVLFHDYIYPQYPQYSQTYFIPWLCFFDIVFNIGLEKFKQFVFQPPILSEL